MARPDRYHRQRLLPMIGDEGQTRLARATVLVAGCGALGCALVDALARAGVGRLRLVDRDVVELTNLQRQCLFAERHAHAAVPKAVAAAERVGEINSEVVAEPVVADLGPGNASALAEGCDLILDGLDNFETRYLLNDLAIARGLPYLYGGAVATEGMTLAILPDRPGRRVAIERPWDRDPTPCLRCLFPEPPPPGSTPTCDTAGVLGPAVSIVAALQAAQAIRLLAGDLDGLDRALTSFDLASNEWRRIDVAAPGPSPDCPACGKGRLEYLDAARGSVAAALCGRDAVQVTPGDGRRLDLEVAARALAPHGRIELTPHLLRGLLFAERTEAPPSSAPEGATTDSIELTLFADGRALVKGTRSVERARAIYARYVGI